MFDFKLKTIIEPFKIKVIEPLPILNYEQRKKYITQAYYNLFNLKSEQVSFDFLTDSGTSAMSAEQWSAIMRGDESYAGSKSFYFFESAVRDITGLKYVIPTHQGRAAEFLLFKTLLKPQDIVVSNTHFDTTRANIESIGAKAVDLPVKDIYNSQLESPFKGNIDCDALETFIKQNRSKIKLVILTITNNSVGGQPVSLQNIADTKKIVSRYGIPLFIDMARFAENAYFIKQRETEYKNLAIKDIVKKIFSYADGALMSAKKDAFVNIGGFLALQDEGLAQDIRSQMVLTEGFPTYGGLAGRDMAALAVGLYEVMDEEYLKYRIRSVEYFAQGLDDVGLKVVKPSGGHAVYIDAALCLPHIKPLEFPAQSLCVVLYEAIGIRGVEVGSVMLGYKDEHTGEEYPAKNELVRLAIPRRVYTQSHIDYIIEASQYIVPHLPKLKGYRLIYQAKFLRHFTAKFAPIS